MQGNPEVIDALNRVYGILLAVEVQAHQQEHQFEADGYKKVSDWFDCIEDKGHRKLIHPLMNRINEMGGPCRGRWAFQPDEARPIERLDEAIRSIVGRLREAHRAYLDAYAAAETARDPVTCSMITKMLKWVEKRVRKFEDRMAQIQETGLSEYLAEMFDKR